MEDKKYIVEFTMEELEVLQLSLKPTGDFCRELVFFSRDKKKGSLEHHLDVAVDLLKRVTEIILINTPN